MDLFNNAKVVQLRSHLGKYLYADEDKYSVGQNRNGSSENSRWTVELVDNIHEKNIIRLKSCNGKYLTASNQRFVLGLTGRKVLQTLPCCLDYSVEWEPIREGDQVKLKTCDGRFLRANGVPAYRNSVTHYDPALGGLTQDWNLWDVEVVVIRSPAGKPLAASSSAPTDKIQLINEEGVLDVRAIETFEKQVKLAESGNYYSVVSIMGGQSSGKSTLLNHLFRTNFGEMNAVENRCRTTKGIWLAKCADIERCTLVMDLEGTDGRERGVDDTAFEKQTAVFALAVSDIILINMWCHDIGREQAANKPLLRSVFKVLGKLFGFGFGKTTLLFVIRDKSEKSPMEVLEKNLREDIGQIWNSFDKPDGHELTPLEEIFNVEIVALSNYEHKEDQYKEEVASLKQQLFSSVALEECAGDGREVIPARGFSCSVQEIWKAIREYNDLGQPSHKEEHTPANVKKPIAGLKVVAGVAKVAIFGFLVATGQVASIIDLLSSLLNLYSIVNE